MNLKATVVFLYAISLHKADGHMFKKIPEQRLITFYSSSARRSAVECLAVCAESNHCKIASYVKTTRKCCHGNDTEAVEQSHGSAVYKTDRCLEGWTLVGDRCLMIINTINTWQDSQSYCQSLGGNLAHVYSLQDIHDIRQLMPCGCRAWLGINDRDTEGEIKSQVGHNISSDIISMLSEDNVESNDCSFSKSDMNVYMDDCNYPLKSVCEMEAY